MYLENGRLFLMRSSPILIALISASKDKALSASLIQQAKEKQLLRRAAKAEPLLGILDPSVNNKIWLLDFFSLV